MQYEVHILGKKRKGQEVGRQGKGSKRDNEQGAKGTMSILFWNQHM